MTFAKASKTRVILIGRKSEKSVIHVQSCWLANIKILLFCRSRCGRRRISGSLRCGRFRGDGDVTAQVDWARGCRSRAKINLLKILMTASVTSSSTSAVLSEIQSLLFVA